MSGVTPSPSSGAPTPRKGAESQKRDRFFAGNASFDKRSGRLSARAGTENEKAQPSYQQVGQSVHNFSTSRIKPQWTSGAFLEKVKTKNQSSGKEIKRQTKGVGDYLGGDASKYNNFIGSLKK